MLELALDAQDSPTAVRIQLVGGLFFGRLLSQCRHSISHNRRLGQPAQPAVVTVGVRDEDRSRPAIVNPALYGKALGVYFGCLPKPLWQGACSPWRHDLRWLFERDRQMRP